MLGGKTRRALRAWQESKEVEATGYLTREQGVVLVALGRKESERRVQAERDRKEREAEERRRVEAERREQEAEARRRAEAERKEREAHEAAPLRRFTERLGRPFSAEFKTGAEGWTDMHYAALLDLPGVVTALVDAGMDVDTRLKSSQKFFSDYLKRTLAAALGHKGFEGMPTQPLGRTPLMIAATGNARKAAEALIARGADVNAKNLYDYTPLHTAAQFNALDVAKLLIERGADINAKDDEDETTPLDTAAQFNALDVAKLLIDRGASVNAKDSYGARPLHHAAMGNAPDVAKLLIERGASVNAKDEYGTTALHHAAEGNAPDVAKLLIERGASVNAKDRDGATPLDCADPDDGEVQAVLRRHGGRRYTGDC